MLLHVCVFQTGMSAPTGTGSLTSEDVLDAAGVGAGTDSEQVLAAVRNKREQLLKKIMRITDEIEEEQAKKGGQYPVPGQERRSVPSQERRSVPSQERRSVPVPGRERWSVPSTRLRETISTWYHL